MIGIRREVKVLKVDNVEDKKRICFTIGKWKVKQSKRSRRMAKLREEWYRIHGLSFPCRICGSSEHTALTRIMIDEESVHSYNCPISKWEHWPKAIPDCEYSPEMSLEASPGKLAEYRGYGRLNIEEGLLQFEERGNGANMEEDELERFKEEARHIGDEVRATAWIFKRMSLTMENDSNGERQL